MFTDVCELVDPHNRHRVGDEARRGDESDARGGGGGAAGAKGGGARGRQARAAVELETALLTALQTQKMADQLLEKQLRKMCSATLGWKLAQARSAAAVV